MKNSTKLFLFIFFVFPFIAFSQNEISGNIQYKNFSNSANLHFMELPTSPDILLGTNYGMKAPKDKCITYKRMKTTGLILTIAGSVVMAGGIALILSVVETENLLGLDDGDDTDLNRLIAGYGCSLMGGASLSAGIPLLIIGNIKSNKFCSGKESSYLSAGAQDNGVGMKLTF